MNRQTDKFDQETNKRLETGTNFLFANIYAELVTVRWVRLVSVQKKLFWIHFPFVKTLPRDGFQPSLGTFPNVYACGLTLPPPFETFA